MTPVCRPLRRRQRFRSDTTAEGIARSRAALGVLAALMLAMTVSCTGDSLDFEMTPLTVAGRIVDADGAAIEDSVVHGGAFGQVFNWDGAVTRSDSSGRFVIDLPPTAETTDLVYVQVTSEVAAPAGDRTIDTHYRAQVRLGEADHEIVVPAPRVCEHALEQVLERPELCGEVLLPDLVPILEGIEMPAGFLLPPESWFVDTTTQPERTLLRMSSTTANLGAGLLHMIPDGDGSTDRIATWQRIWTDELQYIDVKTGSFVFHETHDHFHVDDFEQYRLLTPNGDEIARGEKVSFCLIDVVKAVPSAPGLGFGVHLATQCREAREQQALNPGWADYYGADLDDQWIDITGVQPGDYVVEMTADPTDVLLEADETNNAVQFPISLTREVLDDGGRP